MSRGESVMVDLPHLVDLSVGTPNIGNINSSLLHTLLHVIIRRLEMDDLRVELKGESAAQVRHLLPLVEEPSLFLTHFEILANNEREMIPPPRPCYPRSVLVAERRREMNEHDVRRLQDAVDTARRRSKSRERERRRSSSKGRDDERARAEDEIRRVRQRDAPELTRLQDAVTDINTAIADMLPSLLDSELGKFKDLRTRIEILEKNMKCLVKFVGMLEADMELCGREGANSIAGSARSEYSSVSADKRAPGFLAKEQMDLLTEGLLKDKDGRFFSRIEDKIKTTILRDLQRQLARDLTRDLTRDLQTQMSDLIDRIKDECCRDRITNDTVNNRLQQQESDLLKAMRDMCQGEEIKSLIDNRVGELMDRLAKVEKLARAQVAAATAANSCQYCPDAMCLTCCPYTADPTGTMSSTGGGGSSGGGGTRSGSHHQRSPERRPATPAKSGSKGPSSRSSSKEKTCPRKKSASKSNSVERPPKEKPHPRRLSQKSKSEIEFDPGIYMSGFHHEQPYRENKAVIEYYKPLPPPKESKLPGRFFSRSRPESINCEQYAGQYPPDDCPYCSPQAQKKTKILPCGCVCEYTSGRKASSLKELSGNKKPQQN